ncbi:hypothetical protein [Longispora urticae]
MNQPKTLRIGGDWEEGANLIALEGRPVAFMMHNGNMVHGVSVDRVDVKDGKPGMGYRLRLEAGSSWVPFEAIAFLYVWYPMLVGEGFKPSTLHMGPLPGSINPELPQFPAMRGRVMRKPREDSGA